MPHEPQPASMYISHRQGKAEVGRSHDSNTASQIQCIVSQLGRHANTAILELNMPVLAISQARRLKLAAVPGSGLAMAWYAMVTASGTHGAFSCEKK